MRNSAYYRAGWDGKKTLATNQLLLTAQGNFIDICVLEWLKLFESSKDKHHWSKIVADAKAFEGELLDSCGASKKTFEDSLLAFKRYRDKFVAHLDLDEVMHIPVLDIAVAAVRHYYQVVLAELQDAGSAGLPRDIDTYYRECLDEGRQFFAAAH